MAAGAESRLLARLAFAPPRPGLAVLAGSLALNVLALAMPLAMLQVFDRIIPFQSTSTLLVLFIGLLMVTVLELILRLARIVLLGHAGAAFETGLGAKVMDHTLHAVSRDHERETAGTHFERFGTIVQLREHYAGQGRLLAIDLPFTIIFVALIGLIGGWLVLVPVCLLATIGIAGAIMRRVQSGLLDQRASVDARRYSFLIEFLGSIATVKSYRMEGQMLRRYELLHAKSVDASRRIITLAGTGQTLGASFGQLSVAAMGLSGAYFVIAGTIGIGDLAACMLLNGRTTQPLLKVLSLMSQQEGTRQARAKIGAIAATPRRPESRTPRVVDRGAITLRDVAFRHPASGTVLFEDVTADIAPSETVTLRSGDAGGKSSLLRMIMAEQAPWQGFVLIDGKMPQFYGESRGAGGIAILEQDPVIFDGTILENVTLFGSIGSRDRALAMSQSVGLDFDVRALPLGYQTRITADGGPHSQGFYQRLCVARILCLEPKILLFNNAASAVDPAAAAQIARALADHAGHATMLIVSGQPALRDLARRDLWLSRPSASAATRRMWQDDLAAESRLDEIGRRQSA